MIFSFLGSYYSSIYNMYQGYLFDFIVSFMVMIMVFVVLVVLMLMMSSGCCKFYCFNGKLVELVCGVVPVVILVVQVGCSLGMLFYDGMVTNGESEEGVFGGSKLDIKVVGHQWYWVYEYSGLGDWMKFDSYLLGLDSLGLGDLAYVGGGESFEFARWVLWIVLMLLLEMLFILDNVPSYGFKLDALPGMVNVHLLRFDSVGVYYGMCSEICGAGQSYMPIVVEVVPDNVFFSWLEDYKHKFDIATRLGDW
uniref:Cytochrome c oxidase subunit 2 n=1 Tax=Oxyuris equi TaxID=132389 RepID=A0A0G2TD04_9BILA|nr:cytochrome c oxidase subunit II [Oxyuris equi]AKI07549.1 cytochrome c oxidase subunit 2 [Oxyuris equi]